MLTKNMGYLNLKLRGAKLESPSMPFAIVAPNPVYKLSAFQMGQAEPFQVVMSSEIVSESSNPIWKAISIDLEVLCNNDTDYPIMISVFDYAEQEILIGACETTVSDLIRNKVGNTDECDVSKVFSLKDANAKNETGLIVVVEAFISDELLVEDDRLENSHRQQNVISQNKSEIESLRNALDGLLVRTEKLEAETAYLRHDNKRLSHKVALLEETLLETRTKMKAATKEMNNLMNDANGSLQSINNCRSTRLKDNFLDESLSESSHSGRLVAMQDDRSGKAMGKGDMHNESGLDRSGRSLRHGARHEVNRSRHRHDDRSLSKDESRSGRRERARSPHKPDHADNDDDGRSHYTKDSHYSNQREHTSVGTAHQGDSRSTHTHHTREKSHHHKQHGSHPVSREASPDRGATRSASPRVMGANRARKERSRHRDRAESPIR